MRVKLTLSSSAIAVRPPASEIACISVRPGVSGKLPGFATCPSRITLRLWYSFTCTTTIGSMRIFLSMSSWRTTRETSCGSSPATWTVCRYGKIGGAVGRDLELLRQILLADNLEREHVARADHRLFRRSGAD